MTPRFLPSPGGAETYASDLTTHLHAFGWASYIATDMLEQSAKRQTTTDVTTSGDLQAQRVVSLEPPFEQLADARQVRWRALQFGLLDQLEATLVNLPRVELVHANSIEAAILGRIVADHLGVPLVATIHEHAPEKQSFGTGRCEMAFRRLQIDALIAPSDFYFERALQLGFPVERIHRVVHGISQARLTAAPSEEMRARWGIPDTSWVATLIGRIYSPKGILEFIEAARALRVDPRFRAVIVGPEGPGKYLTLVRERIERYGLHDVVRLVGEVHHSLIPSVMRSSNILVAPSLAEGFGLAVVEAMSMGIPVVASRVGGLMEVIRHDETGLLVEPGDHRALASAMQILLSSPQRAMQLASAAHADANSRFSAERMAAETAQIYANLVT